MGNTERRAACRYGLEMPARLSFRDNSQEAEVSFSLKTGDVSSSGACLKGSVPVEVGTEMEIRLEIPLDKLRNVTSRAARVMLSGVVVRVSGESMALSFRDEEDSREPGTGRNQDRAAGRLTALELEILEKIREGESSSRISGELGMSRNRVESHLSSILKKSGDRDRLRIALHSLRRQ